MQPPWMSVVVPAYNEEEAIGTTLAALSERLGARGLPYEILVVDNASTDGTAGVVGRFADGDKVRLLVNDVNRGKGYSVRRGMLEAPGRLRLRCDAACSPSLASLDRLLEVGREAHVVVGSRVAE